MIVISLALVIAAAVSLFLGLFVFTESLAAIFVAIALCLVSLLLLWLGTRSRKPAPATASAAPVYGGGARSGGSVAPARGTSAPAPDELDDAMAPAGATVVRKTTARDRAATRVADADATDAPSDDAVVVRTGGDVDDTPAAEDTIAAAPATAADEADTAAATAPAVDEDPSPVDASTAVPATAKKSAAKKSTGKKATRKSTAKKATAKKSTAKKSTAAAAASGGGTTGAQARARLAQIAGVGPAKQDALLAQYGSVESIAAASVDDIVANVKGFGPALASRVKDDLSS